MQADTAGGAGTFADIVRQLSQGRFDAIAMEAFQEVVAAVHATGKSGKLTIVLTVKPNEEGRSAFVTPDVKSSPPNPKAGDSLYFTTADGELLRRDPDQPEFALREAPVKTVKLRSAE